MRTLVSSLALLAMAACSTAPATDPAGRSAPQELTLPPMKNFAQAAARPAARSNRAIAADILDLTFALESGRILPVLTRFEGPITVRVTGKAPPSLPRDLAKLIGRLRSEAGIDITQVRSNEDANINIQVVSREDLNRAVPQAACFVVPRVQSWKEFKRARRTDLLDWTTLETREKMAIFLPGDVAPQEVRDCLHEELAQAIGPLNDLYRLPDSVFNDDNFHTVLTGFDMLVLRTIYDDELRSGMTREEVSRHLPSILRRLNPRGRGNKNDTVEPTPRAWITAIETALGPRTANIRRREAAFQAVDIARARKWDDNRLAFSLYALGRLSIASEPEVALAAFLQSGKAFRDAGNSEIQAAHVAMQLSAFALSAGQSQAALDIVDANIRNVARAENAALLSTYLMVKAEALALQGDTEEAAKTREDSLGWARYGFGSEELVKERVAEIAALTPLFVRSEGPS